MNMHSVQAWIPFACEKRLAIMACGLLVGLGGCAHESRQTAIVPPAVPMAVAGDELGLACYRPSVELALRGEASVGATAAAMEPH